MQNNTPIGICKITLLSVYEKKNWSLGHDPLKENGLVKHAKFQNRRRTKQVFVLDISHYATK